ncbi:hypothetical protein [Roseateles sp. P5_E7]
MTMADSWQQYAKEGESAQQCIERHRSEQDSLMRLLAQARSANSAARDVLAERQRQIEVEGWTPAHDDEHHKGSLALAAACYACNAATWAQRDPSIPPADYAKYSAPGFRWPWAKRWWKPKSQRSDLIRAAALLLAEIERLDRAADRLEPRA